MRVSKTEVAKASEIAEELQRQRDIAKQRMDAARATGGDDYRFWCQIHRDLHMTEGRISNSLEFI